MKKLNFRLGLAVVVGSFLLMGLSKKPVVYRMITIGELGNVVSSSSIHDFKIITSGVIYDCGKSNEPRLTTLGLQTGAHYAADGALSRFRFRINPIPLQVNYHDPDVRTYEPGQMIDIIVEKMLKDASGKLVPGSERTTTVQGYFKMDLRPNLRPYGYVELTVPAGWMSDNANRMEFQIYGAEGICPVADEAATPTPAP